MAINSLKCIASAPLHFSNKDYELGYTTGYKKGYKDACSENQLSQNGTNDEDRTEDDQISRQAAIRVASGYCHPANIVKELEKLPPAQPELPWIPCKKQLPVKEGDYFVTVDPRYVPPGYRSTDVITWRDGKWVMADYFVLDSEGRKEPDFKVVELDVPIIAWMPLPEPYKGEQG